MTKQKVVFKLTQKYREKINNLLKKHNTTPDLVDTEQIWDTTLSPSENLREFKRILQINDKIQNVRDEQEKFNEELQQAEKQMIRKKFEETIQQIKNSNIAELTTYYNTLNSYTETLIRNNKINGLIIIGKRGMGKTFNLIMKLENLKVEGYNIIKGHISPLSVFKTLYQNKENGVIIFDDIIGLLKNEEILSLLLGATDYDNRTVKWISSKTLMDLPNSFVFNGKIIILLNHIEQSNEFLNALKDRCYTISLNFSNEEIIQMLYIIANKRGISYEVVDFLKEMNRASLQNLSLRTLDKTQNIYQTYNNNGDWKGLAREMLEYDEVEDVFIEIVGDRQSVKEQVREWIERTGYSRRQFFYLKKQLVQKCKVQLPNTFLR